MAEQTSTFVSQTTAIDTTGRLVSTTNYKVRTSQIDVFSQYDTPSDVPYFPGALNKAPDGSILLSPHSTQDDYEKSAVQSSHKMGVPHPTEITAKFSDPEFPASLASPLGFNPDNPTEIKDRKALLARLIAKAEDENFDPSKIIGLSHELDQKSFLPDLNPLTLVGDPRWSLGAAMQTMYQQFLPKIDEYLKAITPTASFVNAVGQICDADGNPIEISKSNSSISYDVNGNVSYNIPENSSLPKPPTAKEMKTAFLAAKDLAFKNHADAFIQYLRKNYLEIPFQILSKYPPRTTAALAWTATPIYLEFAGFFFIKLIQQIVEKIPVQEVVIIDEFQAEAFLNKERFQFGGRGNNNTIVDPSITGIIGPVPQVTRSMLSQNTISGHSGGMMITKYYYAYRYKDGYVRSKGLSPSDYNPYNIPEREDPDAPAPPARAAVYDQSGTLISAAFPKGKPGILRVINMNLECKRYYPDQRDYIAGQLGVEIVYANNIIADQKHITSLASLSNPIPNYLTMI